MQQATPILRVDERVPRWAMSLLAIVTLFGFLSAAAIVAGALRIREVESALQIGRTQVQVEQIRGDIAKLEASLRIYRLTGRGDVLSTLSRQRVMLSADVESLLRVAPRGAERIRTALSTLPPAEELSDGGSQDRTALKVDLFESDLSELGASIEKFGQDEGRRLGEAMARYSAASTVAIWTRTLIGTLVVGAILLLIRRMRSELRYERTAREQTGLILESLAGSFFAVDSDWKLKFVNNDAARFVRMEPSEMLGMSLWDVFPISHYGSVKEHLTSAMASRRVEVREHQSNPEGRWFEMRAYPFEQGLSISWNDTTDRHVEQERLMKSEELAQQASHAKSLFLASMSHEIRTPLNAIVGSMSLLEHEDLPESAKELIHEAGASGQMLMRLIGDILDYSRVEAGELTMVPGVTNMEEIVASVSTMMQPRAESKNLRLIVKGPGRRTSDLIVDAVRLRQVVINLLSNALKFTTEGSVTLDWEQVEADQTAHLCFAVRDTGVGIPHHRLAAIFDPFTQASSATHAQFGGAGLGLAICKEIVEAMGGTIAVGSIEGSGSEFRVSLALPLASPAQIVPAKAVISTEEQSLDGMSVLLVDDSPVNVMIARKMLERCGCRVTSVDNGLAAVKIAIEQDRFDTILMDVILPDIDGLEAVRRIRAHEHEHGGKRLIIALTANAMREHEVACLQAGMDGYIAKPVTLEVLRETLGRYACARRRMSAERPSQH